MFMIRPFACLLAVTLMGAGTLVCAEETFESHVQKLADDQFAARDAAIKALIKMCKDKPELLDKLAPVVFSQDDDIERVMNAREVVAKSVYTERGAIGFALNRELIVGSLVKDGPAMKSGIPMGAQLLSVAGKSVEGKEPTDIYAMVHATKPGTKLEMEFVDKDGEKLLYSPVVARRSTIRSDEQPEKRRKEAYEEWMERKRKEFENQAD